MTKLEKIGVDFIACKELAKYPPIVYLCLNLRLLPFLALPPAGLLSASWQLILEEQLWQLQLLLSHSPWQIQL